MKRAHWTLAWFVLTAFLCLSPPAHGGVASPDEAVAPSVGEVAPDFTLEDINGHRVQLSSLRGKPLVLTFWAFWCDTWREVRRGYRELADGGCPARLLAVAVDPTRRELLNQRDDAPPLFYPVLLDQARNVSQRYGVRRVPTVLVLDASGRIRARLEGWPTTSRVMEAVREASI